MCSEKTAVATAGSRIAHLGRVVEEYFGTARSDRVLVVDVVFEMCLVGVMTQASRVVTVPVIVSDLDAVVVEAVPVNMNVNIEVAAGD